MLLNCGVAEDSWESLRLQGDQSVKPKGNQPWVFIRRTGAQVPILLQPNVKSQPIGKDSNTGKNWSQNFNNLATSCKEWTHWKRPWCWEILKAGGEEDNRGWDGWMASRLSGQEFEQAPGVGDRQGILAFCNPWGRKSQTLLRKWTQLNWCRIYLVKCRTGWSWSWNQDCQEKYQ